MEIGIRPMEATDWPAVRAIFEEGIASRNATFEANAPDWPAWDAAHRQDCRLVAVTHTGIAGWAALSSVSDRCAYSGVAEVSVYVASAFRGRSIGKALLQALVQASERVGIWTLQAGIFPENKASLALHRACGFRVVGLRERLGQLDGRWRDVLLLERRSTAAGL